MAWNYDLPNIATKPLVQVRRLIGDVLTTDQLMQDEEINWSISQYSNVYLAAADCCRSLSAQFARQVDTVQAELRTLYSGKSKAYAAKALDMEQRGLMRGAAAPYAGGISESDKENQVQDTDRVPPQFNIGMHDDLLPTSPVGNQVPGAPIGRRGPS